MSDQNTQKMSGELNDRLFLARSNILAGIAFFGVLIALIVVPASLITGEIRWLLMPMLLVMHLVYALLNLRSIRKDLKNQKSILVKAKLVEKGLDNNKLYLDDGKILYADAANFKLFELEDLIEYELAPISKKKLLLTKPKHRPKDKSQAQIILFGSKFHSDFTHTLHDIDFLKQANIMKIRAVLVNGADANQSLIQNFIEYAERSLSGAQRLEVQIVMHHTDKIDFEQLCDLANLFKINIGGMAICFANKKFSAYGKTGLPVRSFLIKDQDLTKANFLLQPTQILIDCDSFKAPIFRKFEFYCQAKEVEKRSIPIRLFGNRNKLSLEDIKTLSSFNLEPELFGPVLFFFGEKPPRANAFLIVNPDLREFNYRFRIGKVVIDCLKGDRKQIESFFTYLMSYYNLMTKFNFEFIGDKKHLGDHLHNILKNTFL